MIDPEKKSKRLKLAAESNAEPTKLNRFTSLPIALDILLNRRFTLLSPNLWEDRNDAYCMEYYRRSKNIESILGICFSRTSETFHHWKIFSNGMSGVCIELNYQKFIQSLNLNEKFRYGNVNYKIFAGQTQDPLKIDEVPFSKRYAYHDEAEFRIIYQEQMRKIDFFHISFDIESIQKITFSPWLPRAIFKSASSVIHLIPGCENIKINRSTLIESEEWKKYLEKSTP